jgi:eukaryotic-like serine/threonine-protein kinase
VTFLADGQLVGQTYEVDRFLGEGAFAEVYRVRHRFLGRQAMKVFKATGMSLVDTERALEEATLLSRLGHPNIVRVFDANLIESADGSRGFFTMEYVAGGSLDQFWRSYGSRLMPVPVAIDVIRQVCRGLAVAHADTPPVVHRDIKPQNILVGYDGNGLRVRVSDFGLAKRVNPLTLLASARGTRGFKAPETLADFKADSCCGDVWAVGATMYLLLTDQLPYPELAQEMPMPGPLRHPPIAPSRLNLGVDGHLDCIVLKALSPEPKSRYQTASDLLKDLEAWNPSSQTEPFADTRSAQASIVKTSHTHTDAERMVAAAHRLVQEHGRLTEAADLLEEAINQLPQLRDRFENQLTLWRRGITM